jgi:hypothetical protein
VKLASFLLLATLTACGQSPRGDTAVKPEDCSGLPSFAIQTAKQDAALAYSRKSRELIGTYGYTTEAPGVEEPVLPLRMIEGTSDDECYEANVAIRQYASVYNRELMRLVTQR